MDATQQTPEVKPAPRTKKGKTIKRKSRWQAMRESRIIGFIYTILVPLITVITLEWIARGSFAATKGNDGFFQSLARRPWSFVLAYLLLVCIYVLFTQLTGRHWVGTVVVCLLGNVPAVVTYYKLTMRGEPFLPWDIFQIKDLMAVSSNIQLAIQPSMVITFFIVVLLTVGAVFIRTPHAGRNRERFLWRLAKAGIALAMCLVLLFGVFLSTAGSRAMGIYSDMWMQDRYYRYHGVLTGFLTNLQVLKINLPEGYSAQAAEEIAQQSATLAEGRENHYPTSYGATAQNPEQAPDIIFLMAESFWDVTALEGISYSEDVMKNFNALKEEAASGYAYTPSFGGGTCDVEFEALTGYSMEHLPSGSKPYQQYITGSTFSTPQYLKSRGYDTLAIHGYGRKFWSRDTAYPRLGIDEFIASDDFVDPDLRRGFISDDAMVTRIIEEYEERADGGAPLFIHAVTMQNHTTYDRSRYPADQLVQVTGNTAGIEDTIVGQLEDCATGIRDMDAALGRLTEYLKASDRPTILVFWGDHLNPMSDGYNLFEQTGFIEQGDTASPRLHQTPLLIWSNYSTQQIDLGTIATYNLSPVMMELYGIEMPAYYEFLVQQLAVTHGRTRGVSLLPDGTAQAADMDEAQETVFNQQGILQYNYLFDTPVLDTYVTDTEPTQTEETT